MKDFDFDDIGKKIPYRTPEGFFDEMLGKVMERASIRKKRKRRLRLMISGMVTIAAVFVGILFIPFFSLDKTDITVPPVAQVLVAETNQAVVEPMDKWINELPDEELEEFVNFSENDLFLN